MFLSPAARKSGARHGVIITIGSARVTASWVELPAGGAKPVFHLTVTSRYPHHDTLDASRFIKRMFGTLMESLVRLSGLAASDAAAARFSRPDFLDCVLTAPGFMGQRRTVHTARAKDFRVTRQLLRTLLESELDEAQKEIAEGRPHKALLGKTAQITESAILQIRENGYPTRAPLDKTVRELSLLLYVSYLSRPVAGNIRQLILDSFPTADEVRFVSSTYLTYQGAERFFQPPPQYVIFEVNGEITDVSIVRDHLLASTVSFPLGSATLVRKVAQKTGAPAEDVRARMRLMANAQADRTTPTAGSLEQAVYEAVNAWIDRLYETLKEQSGGRPISPFAYLATDAEWESLFHAALKERAFELFPFSDKSLAVFSFSAPEIRKRCVVKQSARFVPLAALRALSASAGGSLPIDEPQGILYSVMAHHE